MTFRSLLYTGVAAATLMVAAPPAAFAQTTSVSAKPIDPLYRNLRPWYRNLRPWYRNLRPWYRNLRPWDGASTETVIRTDPFRGDIAKFWGRTDPVARSAAAGAPSYTGLAPFWDALDTKWQETAPLWERAGSFEANSAAYGTIASGLRDLVATSKTHWGSAVAARTGKSFEAGFADPFFARFGINPNDAASLARLDAIDQSRMYVEWYDGLMGFSGNDHVDHWMSTINWTPRLTQTQGGGSQATIGLVDFFVAGDADLKSKIVYAGGVSTFSSGHGAGVLSLIAASHDGKGVMGIAPNALIAAYNPFDANGEAGWADVTRGIVEVTKERLFAGTTAARGAAPRTGVVNLSLGVSGWTLHPEWRNVFRNSAVDSVKDHTVYVIAAGNDGVAQPRNIDMDGALDSTFIVVGSVDPNGVISSFSNRPGTACLTKGSECKISSPTRGQPGEQLKESGLLMNRFIVAPGELILVSDDAGGVTRQSGTSLAAPLVAGAVALIHDRWPWLKNKPRDVAKAILDSAKDLGAPGVDPVYGVGLLDVEAAQSPLNFGALKIYLMSGDAKSGTKTEVSAISFANPTFRQTWEARGMFFSAFEKLDADERDFLIPLSSRLIGTTRNGEYFQDFVFNRMIDWATSGGTTGLAETRAVASFSDVRRTPALGDSSSWQVAVSGRLAGGYATRESFRPFRLRSTVEVIAPNNAFSLSFGDGDGALMVGATGGFAMNSDFNPVTGGANPLLGFASGGAHMAARTAVAPGLTLAVGATQQRRSVQDDLRDALQGQNPQLARQVGGYESSALNVRMDYAATSWLGLSASMTRLDENNAFLGIRSLERSDLAGGTVTDGMSLGVDARVGGGFALSGTATFARSRSASDNASLRIGDGGALSSAYQLGASKLGVMTKSDSLRVTVAQPIHVEQGSLDFSSVAVIDRETGERGVVTQRLDIGQTQRRRLVVEGLYSLPIMEGSGAVSLFGRGELKRTDAPVPSLMIGGQARVSF